MMVTAGSRYSTADAELITTAEHAEDGSLLITTAIIYHYTGRENAAGDSVAKDVRGGQVTSTIHRNDFASLIKAWNLIFERAAGVIQNEPFSASWLMDCGNLDVYSWERGVVETLVRVAALELDVTVYVPAVVTTDKVIVERSTQLDMDLAMRG